MPVVASATLEVTPVLSGAQQSLTQQLTGASAEAGDKAGQASGTKFASGMAKKIAVGSAAVAGAVAGVGGALVATASKTAAYGDSIDKASQKLGVSSTFYQEWEAVLQHSGTSMDKMGGTFKRLATASQDASADQQAAFEKLGLSMEDVSKMSPEELFTNVVSGLQGMEEGTERTAVATELLGKGAMEMGALLNTSAEDTQAMIDNVHELGGVMGEDAVKASAQYQDSLQDMQTAFEGVKNGVGAQLLPVLSDFMDRVSDFISDTDLTPLTDTIGQAIDALADFISNLDIEAAGQIFQNVIGAVGDAVGLAWDVISTIFSALKDGLGTITDALGETGTNWDDVWNGISSVISDVAGIIGEIIGIIAQVIADLITDAQTQGTFFNAVWEGIQAAVEGAGTIIKGVIDFVKALIDGDWTAAWQSAQTIIDTITQTIGKVLQAAWNAIKSVAITAWNAIKKAVTKPIEDAKAALSNAWQNIKSTASKTWENLKTTASTTWENIKSAVTKPIESLKSALSEKWENIKSTASRAWESLKEKITKPIEDAKDKVKGILDKVKGFFPLKIGRIFSNLKIPHIKVSGGEAPFGIGGMGKAPHISVEWNKKALQNPFMFQGATLFGAGEAGDEILYGRENLLNDIREAVGGMGGYTQNITINSPRQLNPSEVARQTRNQTRAMVMRMRTT
jgi:hypothetical protein